MAQLLLCGALLAAGCAPGGTSSATSGTSPEAGDSGIGTADSSMPAVAAPLAVSPVGFAAGTGKGGAGKGGSTKGEIPISVADIRAPAAGVDDEESCWYRTGLVIGPAGVEFVGPEIQKLSADEVKSLPGFEGVTTEIGALLQVIDIYAIPADVDPLQAALNMGNGAAPVLMAGYAGHWGYAPGADPDDRVRVNGAALRQSQLFYGTTSKPEVTVGVIDTGFIDYSAIAWPKDRIRAATPLDTEPTSLPPGLAGHGMFVASAILQRAPASEIVVARAGETPLTAFTPDPSSARYDWWAKHLHMDPGYASDELQMFFAADRLVRTASMDGTTFDALNISMGAYLCDQLDGSGLAIRAAMSHWLAEQPGAPVVAAAGNHPINEPDPVFDFAPADLDRSLTPLASLPGTVADEYDLSGLDLLAVAALDRHGMDLAPYSNYKPHDVLAIGTDILAVRENLGVTSWSGSSFATAVVTGAVVNGEAPIGDIYDLGALRLAPKSP